MVLTRAEEVALIIYPDKYLIIHPMDGYLSDISVPSDCPGSFIQLVLNSRHSFTFQVLPLQACATAPRFVEIPPTLSWSSVHLLTYLTGLTEIIY